MDNIVSFTTQNTLIHVFYAKGSFKMFKGNILAIFWRLSRAGKVRRTLVAIQKFENSGTHIIIFSSSFNVNISS